MKIARWLPAIVFSIACAKVLPVYQIPEITVGEPAFFPTIEAYTDAPIVGGNRVEILLNGDQTFPVMLRDIKTARSTITFAQYLYEGGSISHDFAQALRNAVGRASKFIFLSIARVLGKYPVTSRQ
jgi:phosphatidylserine/phosphatidylglycerophosphate/cardiolipin synthase-like enzyme